MIKDSNHKTCKIKFTNIKYYRGGSTCPLRIRHVQNRTIRVTEQTLTLSDEMLKDQLEIWTDNTIVASPTTKCIRIVTSYGYSDGKYYSSTYKVTKELSPIIVSKEENQE